MFAKGSIDNGFLPFTINPIEPHVRGLVDPPPLPPHPIVLWTLPGKSRVV